MFQTKQLLERVHHDLCVLYSETNKGSCFTFLSVNLTKLSHSDVDTVSRGMNKVEEIT